MTSNRFFLPQPALPDSVLWIEGAEHHHLSRVARVRQGETIGLFDEEGRQYRAVVEKVALKKTLVRILSRQEAEEPAVAVVLAPALEEFLSRDRSDLKLVLSEGGGLI